MRDRLGQVTAFRMNSPQSAPQTQLAAGRRKLVRGLQRGPAAPVLQGPVERFRFADPSATLSDSVAGSRLLLAT
jgi:hypothetical protein